MKTRPWSTVEELTDLIVRRAKANHNVILSPDTAFVIANILRTNQKKPSRDEVAALLCPSQCKNLCYNCLAKANAVVHTYGNRFVPLKEPK